MCRYSNHSNTDFGASFLFLEFCFCFFSTLYHPVGQLMVKTDLKMTCGLWMDFKPLYLIFFGSMQER